MNILVVSALLLAIIPVQSTFISVKNHADCDKWAVIDGECINNPNFMWTECHGSCMDPAIKDVDSKCQQWSLDGECTNNPNYIQLHCPVSCGRSVGWNPWQRREMAMDSLPFVDGLCKDACTTPIDLFTAAELMKARLQHFLTGGAQMVAGLASSAPSEYLGMMGLAEAFLYTFRIYGAILQHIADDGSIPYPSIVQERFDSVTALNKAHISTILHDLSKGYSSDLLKRTLPTWVPNLNNVSHEVHAMVVAAYPNASSTHDISSADTSMCSSDTPFGPTFADLTNMLKNGQYLVPRATVESEEGSTTTATGAASSGADDHNTDEDRDDALHNSVHLRNGVSMPLLGLGTWQLNGADCENAVSEAIRTGYRLIDSAQAYGNEADIGWAMRHAIEDGVVSREDMFIATKISDEANDAGYNGLKNLVQHQLELLQTTYIDLYMIHSPMQDSYKQRQTWQAMEELYEQGVLRSIGASNFNQQDLAELMRTSRIKPMVVQNKGDVYHLGKQLDNQGDRIVQYARDNKVVLMAYSPFSSFPFVMKPNEDPLVRMVAKNHHSEGEDTATDTDTDTTASQVLLKWLMQRGVAVIPRSSNAARLRENFLSASMRALSPAEMTVLDSLQYFVASSVSVAVSLALPPTAPHDGLEL